jgi:hypothetical protein
MAYPHQFKDLLKHLRKTGFKVRLTNKCHYKITHPNMNGMVYTGSTPSDFRACRNLVSMIKRNMAEAS